MPGMIISYCYGVINFRKAGGYPRAKVVLPWPAFWGKIARLVPADKGCNQATGVEVPAVPMNFDVADDCLGA